MRYQDLEFSIRRMKRNELDFAIQLAAKEGWNPGLHDAECFYRTDPNGFFIGLLDENQPVGCISAVSYNGTFGFIGLYIVAAEHRGTPSFVWFCRYLSYNDPWLVAGGVLKRNVKVAADRRCPNSYNSNARFRAKARVQGTTLANTLVRNHQQGPDHFDDGFLRERSPRKQQENSTHLRRFHWVLEAP
jgi:hypothetical protein